MNGLTFAHPEWFWWGGILLLPLLVLRLRAHLRSARQLPGLVSPRLSRRLVNGAGQGRRWTVFALRALGLVCLCAALAKPRMGFEEIETEIDARNLLIAIDTSRSMMSDDLPPNRLARAKLAAKDIVLSLPDDRIGLIAFAGKPFLQAPLTVDHEAVIEAIDQLDTEIIPRGGTNLSAAVSLALETANEGKLGPAALVLFSDGEALEGLEEIEKTRDRAAEAGLSLLAVGVGTIEGSIIPEADEDGQVVPGEFVRDENGQVVRTRLTPESLQALASKGGAYIHLGGAVSLTQVVQQIRHGIASSREDGGTRHRPIERFLWPLSAAFALLALSHVVPLLWPKPVAARRSTAKKERRRLPAATATLLLLALPSPLPAADPLAGGHAAFVREDYATALAAYESSLGEKLSAKAKGRLQMGLAAAAYRLGNFERAAEAYGAALAEGSPRLRDEVHYNLGNTLFQRGETALRAASAKPGDPDQMQSLSAPGEARERAIQDWEGAIEHFESSLALAPGNPRAAHNRDYVKKRLEELKQQKEQEEQEKEKEKQEEKKEDEKDEKEDKDEEEKKEEEKDQKKNQDNPSDQKQNDSGDEGNPESEDPKPEGQNPDKPENPEGQPDKSDKPDESDKPDNQNPSEPDSPQDGKDEKDGKGDEPPKPNPGETPPQEPESPQDGKLEANPDPAQPQQTQPNQASAAEAQPNPQTGYSPSEARQLLDALADETEVRPLIPLPAKGEKFKNW